MSKRSIKGLKSTGRVSIARAITATRAIKNASAKNATHKASRTTRATPLHVTSSKTATGKHLIAFRVSPHSSALVKNGLSMASNLMPRSKSSDGSAHTPVR